MARNAKSLSSLPLCPLRSLRLNNSYATVNDISAMEKLSIKLAYRE